MAAFEARYPGICRECDQAFTAGQMIERQEWQLGFVHVQCPQVKRTEVCPQCFTERSISGECGCPE